MAGGGVQAGVNACARGTADFGLMAALCWGMGYLGFMMKRD